MRNGLDSQIERRLSDTDWDFPDADTGDDLHAIHPYPAKFIPEIPRALIQALGVPAGTVVFDPFCGAGTTLVESQRMGFRSIGVDLNPIACLLSRIKTTPLPAGLVDRANRCIESAKAVPTDAPVPGIPNLDHWFEAEIQQVLANLLTKVNLTRDPALRDHLRLAVSSIIVRVSNQDSDTRYAALKKGLAPERVFDLFLASVRRIATAKEGVRASKTATIIESDVLDLSARLIPGKVGLVVTSPPYPNAYEYWLYHKYRMWWLGFDPLEVKRREIGARAHFFRRNPATAADFQTQITHVLSVLRGCVVQGGYICFVVGTSRIHGRDVDNAALIKAGARSLGMPVVAQLERTIAPHRKSFNLSHARIKTESLLVLRR